MRILLFISLMLFTVAAIGQTRVGQSSFNEEEGYMELFTLDTLTNGETLTFLPAAYSREPCLVNFGAQIDSLTGTSTISYIIEEGLGSGTIAEADWIQVATGSISQTDADWTVGRTMNFGWRTRLKITQVGTATTSVKLGASLKAIK